MMTSIEFGILTVYNVDRVVCRTSGEIQQRPHSSSILRGVREVSKVADPAVHQAEVAVGLEVAECGAGGLAALGPGFGAVGKARPGGVESNLDIPVIPEESCARVWGNLDFTSNNNVSHNFLLVEKFQQYLLLSMIFMHSFLFF